MPASLLASLLMLAPVQEPATECAASFETMIVDSDTGEGVPAAEVELRPPGDVPWRHMKSDDRGYLLAEGLCPGSMRVEVSKSDHSPIVMTIELNDGPAQRDIELHALHEHHSERVVVVHDEGAESMAASEHLSGADLAETRGQGLADAISNMAGVTTLRGTAGGMAKPVIRGQIGRRNLIIFDGVRHAGQKWGLDHAPEIDPYSAGRITVIKGAATTRIGPDAVGGAVLVDPRPLLRSPGVAGEVSTVGMSNALGGGVAARIDHAPALMKGLAWRAEGNVTRHRAALAPTYALDNTGALNWNAGGRVGYLSEPVDVELGYRILRTIAGICSCLRLSSVDEFQRSIDRGEPLNADLYSSEFLIDRPQQRMWHHLALVRTRIAMGAAGELHLTYAYQFNEREEFDIVRSDVTGSQLAFDLGTHLGDVRYEHATVDLGRGWDLVGTLGGEVARQDNDFTAATTLIPDYAQWSGGAFSVERIVHQRVEFEFGVRYEGLRRAAGLEERDFLGQRAGRRIDESTCTRTDDDGAQCVHSFHAPSGSLGVLVRPVKKVPELSFRVEGASSARIPAIDEQFMNGAAPSFPILGLGSSKLGIERTWGGTGTARYDGRWFLAELAGYGNYIDDYIYFAPEPQAGQCAPLTCTTRGPMPVFAFEALDALFAGAELRLDLHVPRLPFEISGNGSWVRARDLGDGSFLAFVPPDRYAVAGRWLWPDTTVSAGGYLEINGTVVDEQRRVDPDADFAPPPTAYILLGAGAGVEFPGDLHVIRVSLRGNNLLNRRYRDYTSLLRYFADEPGWSLQLRFAVEFRSPLS